MLLEPSKELINKGQNALCRDAFPVMSGQWDVIGTEIEANITNS